MAEAKVVLTAEDHASSVIDHVTKKLGVFNKEGVSMGIAFAVMNQAINYAMQGVQRLADEFKKGVTRAMDFEFNLVHVTNTMRDMDMTVGDLSESLHAMSKTYGVDVNNLTIALRMLTREQHSASESMNVLGQAQLFSTATGEDLTSTIHAIDTTMGVFDLDMANSGYILTKLNQIVNTTGLSVQEVSDIFGRLSPEIRTAGYNLNDVVNILYTLAQTEIGSRKIAPEFEKYLKGLGFEKVTEIPADAVKSIDEQANAVIDTHKKAVDVIGAAWDGLWESIGQGALETLDVLQKWRPMSTFPETMLPGLGDVNEPKENPFKKYFNDMTTAALAMPALNKEMYDITGQMSYMRSMHEATQEVQRQEDAIDSLNRIAKQYNLEQQRASLDIMRIQYGARGRRGGRLTRGEQKEIYDIETDMMGLQIKEAENQLAIGNIQVHGLQDALDQQDMIRRQHDNTVYNEELSALQTSLDAKLVLWRKYYADIHAMNPLVGRETTAATPEQTITQYNRATLYRSYYDWRMR